MNEVRCELCPRQCRIPEGGAGDCRIRVNLGGKLRATTYGRPSAVHIDPMEKKPLYHFQPGSRVFSIATAGCNLHCRNCQNWQLSQRGGEEMEQLSVEHASSIYPPSPLDERIAFLNVPRDKAFASSFPSESKVI